MKDLSVEAEIEAPFQLYCIKMTHSGINRQNSGPIGLQGVVVNGAQLDGVFAECDRGTLASAAESLGDNLIALELPFDFTARKKFISEWASKAKKVKKVAHLPFSCFLLQRVAVVIAHQPLDT